jgi:hypothetical protein
LHPYASFPADVKPVGIIWTRRVPRSIARSSGQTRDVAINGDAATAFKRQAKRSLDISLYSAQSWPTSSFINALMTRRYLWLSGTQAEISAFCLASRFLLLASALLRIRIPPWNWNYEPFLLLCWPCPLRTQPKRPPDAALCIILRKRANACHMYAVLFVPVVRGLATIQKARPMSGSDSPIRMARHVRSMMSIP